MFAELRQLRNIVLQWKKRKNDREGREVSFVLLVVIFCSQSSTIRTTIISHFRKGIAFH